MDQFPKYKSNLPLTGFTSDFFNAFSETVEDNSFDISKQLLKSQISNKSQILISIKIEAVQKLMKVLHEFHKKICLNKIMMEAQRGYRREAKTEKNLIKIFCKISLRIQMKHASLVQRAWINMFEFTKKYKMSQYEPPLLKKSKRLIDSLVLVELKMNRIQLQIGFRQIQQRQKNITKFEILKQIISQVVNQQKYKKQFFRSLKSNNDKISRAEYLFQVINLLIKNKQRNFLILLKNMSLSQQKQNIIKDTPNIEIKEVNYYQNQQQLKEKLQNSVNDVQIINISVIKSLPNQPQHNKTSNLFAPTNFQTDRYPPKISNIFPDRFQQFEQTDLIDFREQVNQVQMLKKKFLLNEKKIYPLKKDTGPLCFSRKGVSSVSKNKSKKHQTQSSKKSPQSQKDLNVFKNSDNVITSMKSYYFPQNKLIKDCEVSPPQSNRWINQSIKQRLKLVKQYNGQNVHSTPLIKEYQNLNNQKKPSKSKSPANYYQFSKSRTKNKMINKKLQKVTSLHNFTQREISVGSESDFKNQIQIKTALKDKKRKKSYIKIKQPIKFKQIQQKKNRKTNQLQSAKQYNIVSPTIRTKHIPSFRQAKSPVLNKPKMKF